MGFPDYFGRNWDALHDFLKDMSWQPGSGYVLVIENSRLLWEKHHDIAGTLVEVWLSAAEFQSSHGKPFHLVFEW